MLWIRIRIDFGRLDRDPHGFALILVGSIQIHIGNADSDTGGQKLPTKIEISSLKYSMFFF
jgi:hypothetical protein